NGGPRDRLFFFSRRRRHTRFSRDWSSDVCSSDLHPMSDTWRGEMLRSPELVEAFAGQLRRVLDDLERLVAHVRRDAEPMWHENKIGRASCRERRQSQVGALPAEKKPQTGNAAQRS